MVQATATSFQKHKALPQTRTILPAIGTSIIRLSMQVTLPSLPLVAMKLLPKMQVTSSIMHKLKLQELLLIATWWTFSLVTTLLIRIRRLFLSIANSLLRQRVPKPQLRFTNKFSSTLMVLSRLSRLLPKLVTLQQSTNRVWLLPTHWRLTLTCRWVTMQTLRLMLTSLSKLHKVLARLSSRRATWTTALTP